MLASELRETISPGITIHTEGPFYAVKIIRLDYLHSDPDEKPFNEVAALQLLETLEPSIGPCPASLPRAHGAFRDDHHLYLFTPYGPGGDLLTYISQRPGGKARRLGEGKACRFFLDIVAALDYLKAAAIVHRDLSLENLVLTLGEEMTAWEAEEEEEEEAALWGEVEEGGEGGRQDADGGVRGGRANIHDQRVLLPSPHPDVLLGENARLPHMPHLLHALGYGPAPPPVPPGRPPPVLLPRLAFPPPPRPSPTAPKPPPPRRHWRCVLIDFGMAVRLPESKSGKTIVLTQQRCRGKLGYVSPESYYEQPINGQSTDVWSLGVILHIFLTGHPLYRYPWDPAFKVLAAGEARQVLAHYREEMKLRLPETAEDLICAMLHPDPKKRPTLSELRGAPWVRELQERTRRAREGRD
ncbi:hypothetical protein NSK_006847 [Nannochloropsis salina CCMP1776]|uniref:Protein kinase domain-containing protein n=1 Tax=Nannochloropsis salina CCMP1776 TaxID=1027361 RepID=A0A4D9CS06_9STRA|nr:hypothetical protein NSK_006847 [Nannochloropsis salina CCMP1776]|eukprot:TFJ81596.1 hypothetical protein NSK_006847 [Nannochloropsis salina CCMP1776]